MSEFGHVEEILINGKKGYVYMSNNSMSFQNSNGKHIFLGFEPKTKILKVKDWKEIQDYKQLSKDIGKNIDHITAYGEHIANTVHEELIKMQIINGNKNLKT